MKTGDGINEALAVVREVARGHGLDDLTRKHLEFAGAHLRAAWIAEDGQRADSPEQVHAGVAKFYRMQEAMLKRHRESLDVAVEGREMNAALNNVRPAAADVAAARMMVEGGAR